METQSISAWFLCKSCGFTFQFRNVDQFLDHKKEVHNDEFRKLRCVLFEESSDERFVLENLQETSAEISSKEPCIFLPSEEKAKFSNTGTISRQNSTSSDAKLLNSYVHVRRLSPKELEPFNKAGLNQTLIQPAQSAIVSSPGTESNFDSQRFSLEATDDPTHTLNFAQEICIEFIKQENCEDNDSKAIPKQGDSNDLNNEKLVTETKSRTALYSNDMDDANKDFDCEPCSPPNDDADDSTISNSSYSDAKSAPISTKNPPHNSRDASKKRCTRTKTLSFVFPRPGQYPLDKNSHMNLKDWLLQEISEPLEGRGLDGPEKNCIRLIPDPTTEDVPVIDHYSPVKCGFCFIKLTSVPKLKIHVLHCYLYNKSCHKICTLCDKTMNRARDLQRHIVNVHRTKESNDEVGSHQFDCKHCDKKFKTQRFFQLHIEAHKTAEGPTPKKTHNCKVCGKTFPSRTNLSTHLKIHSDVRAFSCPYPNCEATFKTCQNLRNHKQIHVRAENRDKLIKEARNLNDPPSEKAPKTFKCEECPKEYSSKRSLQVHLESHKSKEDQSKPFVCERCGSAHSTMNYLKEHYRRHSSSKPYKCNFPNCTKAYKAKSALNCHVRTHSDARPHKCHHQDCHKAFKTSLVLREHMKTHSERPRLTCPHDRCGQTYTSPLTLRMHIIYKHTDPEVARRFPCEICPKKCTTRTELKTHNLSHLQPEERPFKCTREGCTASYALQISLVEHQRKHDGERPYICETCGKGFYRLRTLQRHTQVHTSNLVKQKKAKKVKVHINFRKKRASRVYSESDEKTEIISETVSDNNKDGCSE